MCDMVSIGADLGDHFFVSSSSFWLLETSAILRELQQDFARERGCFTLWIILWCVSRFQLRSVNGEIS